MLSVDENETGSWFVRFPLRHDLESDVGPGALRVDQAVGAVAVGQLLLGHADAQIELTPGGEPGRRIGHPVVERLAQKRTRRPGSAQSMTS
jgi:hypothetical protein